MEPRSFDRGNTFLAANGQRNELLQWSRDLSIAETTHALHVHGRGCLLQWSRDLSIAETAPR